MFEQYALSASIFGGASMLIWWLSSLLLRDEGERLRDRLRVPTSRAGPAERASLGSLIRSIGQAAAAPLMPKKRERQSAMRRQLSRAGIFTPSAIRMVQGCKVLLLAGGMLSGYVTGTAIDNVFLGLSLGSLMGYLAPAIWLKMQIRKHQKALDRGLPDALDLIVICVEAGLTVDAAMQRVAQEVSLAHPRLARELEMTHMETRIGLPRAEALRNLGQRTGYAALQGLATMMIQAERFGTSIAAGLRVHADMLRVQRQYAAEETAAKASVKLSFPVVLFIFPAILIVLAGPAAIGLFKSALFAE